LTYIYYSYYGNIFLKNIIISKVVVSDYPDDIIVKNLEFNKKKNIPENLANKITVVGHAWGKNIEQLKS